jgi:hypothetical protein
VIENALTHPSVTSAQGYLTPAALESASKAIYGKRAHERGHDPFDFAPAAKAVLQDMPNSGTPGRGVLHAINSAVGQTAGAIAGSLTGRAAGMSDAVEPLLIAEGIGKALGPLAMQPLEKAALTSRAAQRFWGNQTLRDRPGTLSLPGLLTAAAAGRSGARGLLNADDDREGRQ